MMENAKVPPWIPGPELFKWIRMVCGIVVIIIACVSSYFALENRIALAEQGMKQETLGYRIIQSDMSKRIDSLGDRLDKRLARIEQHLLTLH